MTISGISASMNSITAIRQVDRGSENSSVAGAAGRPAQAPQGGELFSAVTQALSSIGALDSQDSSGSSTVVQAFGTFMNDLMGALHQHAGGSQAAGSSAAQRPSGPPPERSGPPPGMGQGMQGLSQQSTVSSEGSTSDSADGNVLENSFQALLSALGVSDSNATLQNFLDALSRNMAGASSSGNVVNTQA